ncbi:MAG: hypothetical protein RLZZ225_77 [Pseudomonadota bacterium]|jgi:hypothetical protein
MRLKKTKALRYVVATFLTMGTVLSVGFLSFSGLWVIYPYVVPAILAFFLSGVIEGKVFGTGIFKGLARLKLLTTNAQKHLLIIELNKLINYKEKANKSWAEEQGGFLKDYWQQRKYYKSLKENPHADENALEEAKKDLDALKDFFCRQVSQSKGEANHPVGLSINEGLKNISKVLLKSAKHSVWVLRFFWTVSILMGVVSGFITAFAVNEAITIGLALSLSATALSAIIWPVAIFAAVGATFLLYYVITDIVKNDTVEKAFSKVFELFKRKVHENKKEPLAAYLMRLLSLSLVVVAISAITVFATAASAGTCWIIMRQGINLLVPKLPAFIAYCASAILIPMGFATDLIYGVSTTLLTINNCKSLFIAAFEAIKHPMQKSKSFFSKIKKELGKVKRNESWGQFFNPFRIIAKLIISPLQAFVFIGHLISIGLTADRFLNFPPPLVAGVCAASEGLQDLSFFTTEEDEHNHEEDDGHEHGNLLQLPLQVILSPLLLTVGIHYWFFNKCTTGNKLSFFEAITQSFELPLLNIVFFPLLLPSAVWHWTFKKASNSLTFYESVKKSFDVHTHAAHSEGSVLMKPELSFEWQQRLSNAKEYSNGDYKVSASNGYISKKNNHTFFQARSKEAGYLESQHIAEANLQYTA